GYTEPSSLCNSTMEVVGKRCVSVFGKPVGIVEGLANPADGILDLAMCFGSRKWHLHVLPAR
ncbi:hypothetical protein AB4144_66840, partial [Rhizobiaceae sp. 2RAB30]